MTLLAVREMTSSGLSSDTFTSAEKVTAYRSAAKALQSSSSVVTFLLCAKFQYSIACSHSPGATSSFTYSANVLTCRESVLKLIACILCTFDPSLGFSTISSTKSSSAKSSSAKEVTVLGAVTPAIISLHFLKNAFAFIVFSPH